MEKHFQEINKSEARRITSWSLQRVTQQHFGDGLLHRKSGNDDWNQIVLPKVCRQQVIEIAHSIPMGGHKLLERTKPQNAF